MSSGSKAQVHTRSKQGIGDILPERSGADGSKEDQPCAACGHEEGSPEDVDGSASIAARPVELLRPIPRCVCGTWSILLRRHEARRRICVNSPIRNRSQYRSPIHSSAEQTGVSCPAAVYRMRDV